MLRCRRTEVKVPRVTRSAEVRVSAQQAYDYLKGGDRVKEWIPDVSRSERITPGPVRPGSRIVYAFHVAGRDFEITNEITQLREPEYVGFRAVSGIVNHGYFEVTPLGPGTSRVTLHFEFELPRGPVGALARCLPIDRIIEHYAQASLARLVVQLEALERVRAEPEPTETGEPR
jgi:hypothetical protein